jgi:hypothetical protein
MRHWWFFLEPIFVLEISFTRIGRLLLDIKDSQMTMSYGHDHV